MEKVGCASYPHHAIPYEEFLQKADQFVNSEEMWAIEVNEVIRELTLITGSMKLPSG